LFLAESAPTLLLWMMIPVVFRPGCSGRRYHRSLAMGFSLGSFETPQFNHNKILSLSSKTAYIGFEMVVFT